MDINECPLQCLNGDQIPYHNTKLSITSKIIKGSPSTTSREQPGGVAHAGTMPSVHFWKTSDDAYYVPSNR